MNGYAAIQVSQREADRDVQLASLPVPWQRSSLSGPAVEDTGPTCPQCGGRLVFEQFLSNELGQYPLCSQFFPQVTKLGVDRYVRLNL